jgi:glycine hydroxymethyltransferase
MDQIATSLEPNRIRELTDQHNHWRAQTLNLIASENAISPAVRSALNNDWIGRYSDYTGRDLTARRYRGSRYIAELEQIIESAAKRVFVAKAVELRPLAGHIAGAAVLSALCMPHDTVLELGPDGGSHREATKVGSPSLLPLDVHFLPFDGYCYNLDIPGCRNLIAEKQPRVVILGSSNFLFPHPVKEIKNILREISPHTVLVYDASHVMGFLAAGQFQAPLLEGADIVYGSTHKTFPGPQGGIIYSDREDLMVSISEAVYPALVTNHHSFRMPALGIALAEMETFGRAYMDQTRANSQALGQALEMEGIPCVQVNSCFSQSHTVLMKLGSLGHGADIAVRLEGADIITTATTLPAVQGSQGIRLGTQEITRLGALEADMEIVAGLIADVVLERRGKPEVSEKVHAFTAGLGPVRYTW